VRGPNGSTIFRFVAKDPHKSPNGTWFPSYLDALGFGSAFGSELCCLVS